MRRDGIILILLALLAAMFFGIALAPHSAPLAFDIDSERARIETLFDTHAPGEAYREFKRLNVVRGLEDAHLAGHLFGEALYEREGVTGAGVCDGEFGFACYHSFFGAALAEHGSDAAREFDRACVEAHGPEGLGCFHGIGHGLLAHFGYAREALDAALALCAELSWQRPYGGCSDGVFMEYNLRTMLIVNGGGARPFVESERYEPCASLDPYREACYFAAPAWWWHAELKGALDVARMGAFCDEVRDVGEKSACFRGIGYALAPEADFDAARGVAFCDDVSHVGRITCREGLAWALYADPGYRPYAEGACTFNARDAEATECLENYLFVLQ